MSLKEQHWYNKLTFFYKIVHALLYAYIVASFQDNYPLISTRKLKAILS